MDLHQLAERLFPICRSITGPGVRETLAIIQEAIPITVESVASGTQVLDWEIPDEWTPKSAWIKDVNGRSIIDFSVNNLHLLQYSAPFQGRVSRLVLEDHLYSLPKQPDLIPYRTSYYKKDWGFCLTEKQRLALTDLEYDVCIDTKLEPGVLNYGELFLPGESKDEILISTHICHPSLANDNLSGILVALACARYFAAIHSYYSIRFIFVPGTIGAITWLARNARTCCSVKHGLVLTGLGAGDSFNYKSTRAGDSVIDQLVANTLKSSGKSHHILPFTPYGYDERQYNSPGFALPVGCLMRTPHGSYPEYHTSADNLGFLKDDALEESTLMLQTIITRLGQNRIYQNNFPFGEPQLGRRGLYVGNPEENLALLWVLNLSDGHHSLLEISERSGISFEKVQDRVLKLLAAGMLTLVG